MPKVYFHLLSLINFGFLSCSAIAGTGPTISGITATPSSVALSGKDVPVVVSFKVTPGSLPVSKTAVFFSNNTGGSLSCTNITSSGTQYSSTCTVPKTLATGSYSIDISAYDSGNNRTDGVASFTVK